MFADVVETKMVASNYMSTELDMVNSGCQTI